MEYCSRGSLQAFTKQLRGLRVHPRESVRARRALSRQTVRSLSRSLADLRTQWIMKWFIEVCMAVAYMHQQQIVHRDLKVPIVPLALSLAH